MSLLRESEQFVELGQIRRLDDHRGRGRNLLTRLGQRNHRLGGELAIAGQEHPQGIINGHFARVRRMLQDLQVVLGTAAFVAALAEPIVSDAEARRREQVVPIGVVRERSGLADQ
jgi:hypothetical protein